MKNELHKDTLLFTKVTMIKIITEVLAVPLYQTSTFSFETANQGEHRFSGDRGREYLF